jgi:hypothetical protein
MELMKQVTLALHVYESSNFIWRELKTDITTLDKQDSFQNLEGYASVSKLNIFSL